MASIRYWASLASLALLTGCAQRELVINSEPSGAIVYLNGDEVGRTPMKYDFHWYGNYDVVLRREGYETLKTQRSISGRLDSYPPFDLFGELFGSRDHREWTFQLTPASPAAVEPSLLISRARELEGQLQSSEHTRLPTTRQAQTQPATRAAQTQSATRPTP